MNFPLGNLKIFPYFGGDIDSKEVSEQNLSASIRNLNLSNNGNKYFDTSQPNNEIVPFRILYPYEEEYSSEYLNKAKYYSDSEGNWLEFGMMKGSGTIYGYNISIEPGSEYQTSSVKMKVSTGSKEAELGGIIYFKLTVLTDSLRLKTATTSTSAFDVLYATEEEWNNISKEDKKKCLRVYRIGEKNSGTNIVTCQYMCNLGISDGFECIDSSKYKINIDTNGITLYKYYWQNGQTEATKAGLFLKDNTSKDISVGLITNNITEKIDFSTLRELDSNYMASLTLDNTTDNNALAKMLLKISSRESFISLDKDKIKLQNTNSSNNTTSGITIEDDSTTIEYTKQKKASLGGSFTLNSINSRMAKWFDDEMKTYAHLLLGGSTSTDTTRLQLLSKTGTRTNYVNFTDSGISLKSYLNSYTDRSNELNFNNNYTELIKYIATSGTDKYHSTLRVGTLNDDKRVQLAWQGSQRFSELFFNTSLISMYSKASQNITGIVLKDNIIQLYSTNSEATPANSESYLAFDATQFYIRKKTEQDLSTSFKITGSNGDLGEIYASAEMTDSTKLFANKKFWYKDVISIGSSSANAKFVEECSKCVDGNWAHKADKFKNTIQSGISYKYSDVGRNPDGPTVLMTNHCEHQTGPKSAVTESTTWTNYEYEESAIKCACDSILLNSTNILYDGSFSANSRLRITPISSKFEIDGGYFSVDTYGITGGVFSPISVQDNDAGEFPCSTQISFEDYNGTTPLSYARLMVCDTYRDMSDASGKKGGVRIDLNTRKSDGKATSIGKFWLHYWTGSTTTPTEHWIDIRSKLESITALEEENEQLKNQINSLQEKLLMIEERLNNLS